MLIILKGLQDPLNAISKFSTLGDWGKGLRIAVAVAGGAGDGGGGAADGGETFKKMPV